MSGVRIETVRSRMLGPEVVKIALAVLVQLATATSLFAHDFWIEPSSFRPRAGETITVQLRVGEHFEGDAVGRNPERIERFILAGPVGEHAIPGVAGRTPAGEIGVDARGFHVIAYRSRPSRVELAGPAFEAYLREEGLERISALRAEGGKSQEPGRELFSRCAKAIIAVGGGAGDAYTKPLALPLELILEQSPAALEAGKTLPVRLLYQGKPLPGALVVLLGRKDPSKRLTARSDGDGRARFVVPGADVLLVKAVHMIPAPAGTDADWESLWASLTFEVGVPPSP